MREVLEELKEFLQNPMAQIRKPCGCYAPRSKERVNAEVIERTASGADYIEGRRRFSGLLPTWENTDVVKILDILSTDVKKFYVEKKTERRVHYFCKDCGEAFELYHDTNIERNYREESFEEKLTGTEPEIGGELDDAADANAESMDHAAPSNKELDDSPVDSSVKESILNHTRDAESEEIEEDNGTQDNGKGI